MDSQRKYTAQEKQHLLANLELEAAHKTRQFEAWLADSLQNFLIHQEGQISRIPKLVRGITLRELQKYEGDVQAALRGLQREKLGGLAEGSSGEIDKSTRKRKWIASQETEGESSGSGSGPALDTERAIKSVRTMDATPKKKPGSSTGPGTAQRARLLAANKTPGTSRTMGRIPSAAPSPSPHKPKQPFTSFPRPPSRPTSPSKVPNSLSNGSQPTQLTRPPSSATFNPTLPPKTPVYPTGRLPRRHESMLSLNGSPITNPYDLGIGWFKRESAAETIYETDGDTDDEGWGNGKGKGKGKIPNGKPRELMPQRSNSILVRREPSSFATTVTNGFHSRTNSAASLFASQSSSTTNSNPSTSQTQSHGYSPPPLDATPKPSSQLQKAHNSADSQSFASAMVAIPTTDGHLLEFDPLLTSPRSLDALVGITDSAKKHAREEVGRLVQAAVDKWKIL